MEAKAVKLKPIAPYRYLFPQARLVDVTVKKGADVSHTVRLIPKVVQQCRWQVERFVKGELMHLPPYEALKKLWHWIKYHIAYEKDKYRKEQVRSPRRLVHDAKGDCDCFTTFIDCCASWFPWVEKIENAITKYGGANWQHIYPIITIKGDRRVVMDCVAEAFDFEVPYTDILTVPLMDLEFLDGFGEYDELGKINIFKKGGLKQVFQNVKQDVKQTVQEVKQDVKQTLKVTGQAIKTAAQKTGQVAKQALHVVNKVNPATVLLRAGVLASMKLNVMNVAGRLKWAYMTDSAAQARGADMAKLNKLRNVVKKLEEIFHGAGGEAKNLREAIITGKGNKDKAVSGIENAGVLTPLDQLLGPQVYYTEELAGMYGLGQLGEPATATAVAAASGVLATIAALIKQIGNLFPNKNSPGAADFEAGDNEGGVPGPTSPQPTIMEQATDLISKGQMVNTAMLTTPTMRSAIPASQISEDSLPEAGADIDYTSIPTSVPFTSQIQTNAASNTSNTTNANTNTNNTNTQPSIWQRQPWLKPTLYVAGGLTVAGLGYLAIRAAQRRKPALSGLRKKSSALSGVELEEAIAGLEKPCKCHEKQAPKKRERRKKNKYSQLTAIPLM